MLCREGRVIAAGASFSTHDCSADIIRPRQQRKFDAFYLANRLEVVNLAGGLCFGFFYSDHLSYLKLLTFNSAIASTIQHSSTCRSRV